MKPSSTRRRLQLPDQQSSGSRHRECRHDRPVGTPISVTVGDGHFSDPDAGTNLSYTITVDGSTTVRVVRHADRRC